MIAVRVRLFGYRAVADFCHNKAVIVVDLESPFGGKMDTNNLFRQLLMIGIGTTSLVAERLRQVSDEWVKEGRINPEQASKFVDDFMSQFSGDSATFEAQMQRQLKNVLQDLGVPRQAEMDELRGRIDRLERQVRELENKHWK